jgi:hypothetical protein
MSIFYAFIKPVIKKFRLLRDENFLDIALRPFFAEQLIRTFYTTTPEEKKLTDNLRKKVLSLPQIGTTSTSSAEQRWQSFRKTLRNCIVKNDPRNFFNWEVVKYNMIYGASLKDILYLKRMGYWSRWRDTLIKEDQFNANPFFAFPQTSTNTLRQAYHLAKFFTETKTSIGDISQIIDFGGGYGNMCRLVSSLGFQGQYIIFDSSEFLLLQEYYLKLSKIAVPIIFLKEIENLSDIPTPSIILTEDIETLKKLSKNPQSQKNLLVATWSLSETPIELRNKFLTTIQPKYFLITYQKYFGEVNNEKYFTNFINTTPDILWKKSKMSYLPSQKNYYLVGKKK